jgi:hypothetical protein
MPERLQKDRRPPACAARHRAAQGSRVKTSTVDEPRASELKTVSQAQPELQDLFPTIGSLEWSLKCHKPDYVAGRAVFMIAGRLLVYPTALRRVALEIGNRALAARHCRDKAPPPA